MIKLMKLLELTSDSLNVVEVCTPTHNLIDPYLKQSPWNIAPNAYSENKMLHCSLCPYDVFKSLPVQKLWKMWYNAMVVQQLVNTWLVCSSVAWFCSRWALKVAISFGLYFLQKFMLAVVIQMVLSFEPSRPKYFMSRSPDGSRLVRPSSRFRQRCHQLTMQLCRTEWIAEGCSSNGNAFLKTSDARNAWSRFESKRELFIPYSRERRKWHHS